MSKQKHSLSLGQRLSLAALVAVLPLPPVSGAVAEESISDVAFEQSFQQFETLPAAPSPEGNVVDLTEIAPTLEFEQPATARSLGNGIASYYGRKFNGRRTASGETFDMNDYTAAHKTLPFGTRVVVTNPNNGKSVVVRINDRGPYAHGRTIDLSRAAAEQIGLVARGHGNVELAVAS